MRNLLFLIALFLIVGSCPSFGFPEMIRNGYGNCVTCHVSPTGGGIMTPYGRSLSAELLSTWTSPEEEKFAYLVNTTGKLNLGGDIRGLQLFQNRTTRTNSQFLFMQADVEAALSLGPVTVDATGGADFSGSPISRRHYVSYKARDELAFRAGRFLPAFGVNTENHSIATRRGIGRDQATETYNFEGAWTGENFDLFATAILGRPDNKTLGAESGAALSSSVFLGSSYRIGAGYYYGSRDVTKRHLVGPFAVLGFTKHFFLLFDSAFQILTPQTGAKAGVTQSGFVDYLRLDYEVAQGLHLYVTQEYTQLDLSKGASTSDAYGLGVQWFPRPHLELNALWQKQRIGGSGAAFADYAFLMAHFYL